MAKKNLKDAAAAGTSVFDTIANGQQTITAPAPDDTEELMKALHSQYSQDTPNLQYTQDAQEKRGPGRPKSADPTQWVRLNLKLPTDLRAYLQAAAFRESTPKKICSMTEYLCNLIREDMEKHKDD